MAGKFGILGKLTFLQDIAASVIAAINPFIIQTIEKYTMLAKIFCYAATENIEGDYLEFGVYAGSSFCHAIKSL
jgi:hypothetical protein